MKSKDDLIEELAAIEHTRWSDWQRWLHKTCWRNEQLPGDLLITRQNAERWERQIATPYAGLSEAEKQSDRDQVARYWPLIVEFVAEWLSVQVRSKNLAQAWRREMDFGSQERKANG